MSGIRLEHRHQASEVDGHRQFCRINRTIRQSKHGRICSLVDSRHRVQIALGVLPLHIGLGFFDALLKRSQGRFFVHALQRDIAIHDAFRCGRMRPQLHSVCPVKRISHRVVEVIMRVQSALHGHLADHP